MTIEGLGKKFQEARLAKNLTLDEAARMTKIRPSRLAEIEADDFSQFPSLAYAKGFLLIYGKFLDVDVTPYMEAFETSEQVTVDGYSYLQDHPTPKPVRAPTVRHVRHRTRPTSSAPSDRTSVLPVLLLIIVPVIGFFLVKSVLQIGRLRKVEKTEAVQATPSVTAPPMTSMASSPPPAPASPPPSVAQSPPPRVATAPTATASPPQSSASPNSKPVVANSSGTAAAPPAAPSATTAAAEPEVRRAEPVKAEDLAAAGTPESKGPNRVAVRPLKKTYVRVVVDNESVSPAFERWISPNDGTVEFRGQHISIRVLDRDALQIKKNGKPIADGDADVTIE